MTSTDEEKEEKKVIGNLLDFVEDEHKNTPLDIEVAVKDDGRVVVFHNKPFKFDMSWFEFDLETNKLDFILDDGETRDFGLPLAKDVAKYMQNSHQILMVLMDDETGEATKGKYVPLIIHRT